MKPSYLKHLHETNQYVEIFWWPYTSEVWIKTWNPSPKPMIPSVVKDAWSDVTQQLASDFGMFLLDLVERKPHQTPVFCKGIWELAKATVIKDGGKSIVDLPHALHYQKYIDTVRCVDTEYCIKVDPDYNNIAEAFQVILDQINLYKERDLYPINITVEIRTHGRSTCMLSPSFSTDPTEHHCYIEFLSHYKTPSFEAISRDISSAWIKNPKLKARPHWAKLFQTVELKNLIPSLQENYGENWNKWRDLRDKMDPNRMFMNDYFEKMFYGPFDPPDVEFLPSANWLETTPIKARPRRLTPISPTPSGTSEKTDDNKVELEKIGLIEKRAGSPKPGSPRPGSPKHGSPRPGSPKSPHAQHFKMDLDIKSSSSKEKIEARKKYNSADTEATDAKLEEIIEIGNGTVRPRSCIIS